MSCSHIIWETTHDALHTTKPHKLRLQTASKPSNLRKSISVGWRICGLSVCRQICVVKITSSHWWRLNPWEWWPPLTPLMYFLCAQKWPIDYWMVLVKSPHAFWWTLLYTQRVLSVLARYFCLSPVGERWFKFSGVRTFPPRGVSSAKVFPVTMATCLPVVGDVFPVGFWLSYSWFCGLTLVSLGIEMVIVVRLLGSKNSYGHWMTIICFTHNKNVYIQRIVTICRVLQLELWLVVTSHFPFQARHNQC